MKKEIKRERLYALIGPAKAFYGKNGSKEDLIIQIKETEDLDKEGFDGNLFRDIINAIIHTNTYYGGKYSDEDIMNVFRTLGIRIVED